MHITKNKKTGFSLAEVMIAILVIVIGLAGVTAALVYGVRNSTRGKFISESTQIARKILEYTQATGLVHGDPLPSSESGVNDSPDERRFLNAAPFNGLEFRPQNVEKYRRNIRLEKLTDDPNDHRFNLLKVTVTVYWNDTQGEHNSQMTGVVRYVRN